MASNSAKTLEYLTFKLGDEVYGVGIQRVQELRGYTAVTKIASTPEHIGGASSLSVLVRRQ